MRKFGDKTVHANYFGEQEIIERYVGEQLIFSYKNYPQRSILSHFHGKQNRDIENRVWTDLIQGLIGTFGDGAVWVNDGVRFNAAANSFISYPNQNAARAFTICHTFEIAVRGSSSGAGSFPRLSDAYGQVSIYLRTNSPIGAVSMYYSNRDLVFSNPHFIPKLNTRYNVIVRWDGTSSPVEVFINGILFGTIQAPTATIPNVAVRYIGNRAAGDRGLNGVIYQHAFYDDCLTDDEINQFARVAIRDFNIPLLDVWG
jgi:hypothetical protein